MDVEVNTGREGTWRSTATDDVGRGGAGMEVQVVPLEMYDSARAKIAANLRWLFGKAFGPGKAYLCTPHPHPLPVIKI